MLAVTCAGIGLAGPSAAQPTCTGPGCVTGHQKLSDTSGGLSGPGTPATNPGGLLANSDRFGGGAAGLGDLDGDGVADVAVGAYSDDDGGFNRGAVYVLFLNPDGTVKQRRKISDTSGSFSGPGDPGGALGNSTLFGISLAALGDVDGDGVVDLAVGSCGPGGTGSCEDAVGAAWVILLQPDGSVKSAVEISDTTGLLVGGLPLAAGDTFGVSVAAAGDVDGDRIPDLLVAAWTDDDGGSDRGAVYVLFLEPDGRVRDYTKLSDTSGGLSGPGDPGGVLADGDGFGRDLTALGDLDGDGVPEIAVATPRYDGAGTDRGAVWILWLHPDGTVKQKLRIAEGEAGFGGALADGDRFGDALASLGDLDGDGVPDLAVGLMRGDGVFADEGYVWILLLNADGSVADERRIGSSQGVAGLLEAGDFFGSAVAALGDVSGDGVMDLGVGARQDDDGGTNRGAFYELHLDGAAPVCGNGALDPVFEECDDGGSVDGDGCTSTCRLEPCGNGILQPGLGEECDDGDATAGDGCSATCQVEYCGDGIPQPGLGEECDDGNATGGDGCAAACWVESASQDLFGTGMQGSVSITLNGVEVAIATSAGQGADLVLAALATAIGADATLAGLGVHAAFTDGRLLTNGSIGGVTVSDQGLSPTPPTAVTTAYTERTGFDAATVAFATAVEDFESLADRAPVAGLGGISVATAAPVEAAIASAEFATTSPALSVGADNADGALLDGDALALSLDRETSFVGISVVTSDPAEAGEIVLATPVGAAANAATPAAVLGDGGFVYFVGLVSDTPFSDVALGFTPEVETHFVYTVDDVIYLPEPGLPLSLGSCVALLVLLQRRRERKEDDG